MEVIYKNMKTNKCQVCNHKFFERPLLRYENMPKAAQFLPDANSLKNDKGIDLEVCQCSGCGLVQLNNDPVPYYKEVIRSAAISPEMKDFRLKQFTGFVKKYFLTGKKIIEIGAGQGEYLSLMQQCGVKAYGLEASYESVKHCKKNGLNVRRGFIQNNTYKLKDALFDAFFILNYLEHLPYPNSTLIGINNNLSEDAVGIVEVPNFDMILRKKLFSEFIADHLFYFNKETLSSTLKLNGFEIIECHEIFHDYIISVVVKKRKKLNISHFYEHQTKIKKDIEKYLNQYKSKKVAIWGAGHQALAIILLINLADKIRYVVDSAVFKQNKYTPATHIPIVSPERLYSDQVDAIIIITGGYSDEVVKIIQQKYGSINIAVLRDYGLEIIKS
jgi:2-polyprenyl-3-methyl-5-hydroxy-6-metoxy-1,4-benzoquinol methylase